MHELSLAQSLLDIVEQELARHGATRAKVIRLDVGEFTAVVPESLSFCFEVITKDTPLEGVRLEMNPVPLTGRCRGCGKEFRIQDYNFACPRCAAMDIETIAGKELLIREIEAE
ncbi:MAG: hydrogenase maturation nickel metallochaperone HypA [Deltaproteobacteria bacterium]|nr:hydrogenase maturation nickel metallochaperone HypA [Deltaproteobacteria bacterium]